MFGGFFRAVPSWDMAEAKRYLEAHKVGEYNLIDVRQPEEYAEGHLPGATLVPLGELPARLDEIDRDKPTLVYCRSGGRAGNATALLTRAGFAQAHSIGGITQWEGLVATGAPEAGMAVFDAARRPEEYVALAWSLEEGARTFYLELAGRLPELAAMFDEMAVGEAHHRDLLAELYRELTGGDAPPPETGAGLIEGGIEREAALGWARGREAADVLEFAAAMEANAHDRYIHVGRAVGGQVERAFLQLAEAEKVHLGQLMRAFLAQLR